jgi:hypothetical protein
MAVLSRHTVFRLQDTCGGGLFQEKQAPAIAFMQRDDDCSSPRRLG